MSPAVSAIEQFNATLANLGLAVLVVAMVVAGLTIVTGAGGPAMHKSLRRTFLTGGICAFFLKGYLEVTGGQTSFDLSGVLPFVVLLSLPLAAGLVLSVYFVSSNALRQRQELEQRDQAREAKAIDQSVEQALAWHETTYGKPIPIPDLSETNERN